MSITVEPPIAGAPPPHTSWWRRHLVAIGFVLPASVFLGVWIVYPTVRTVIRSFYDINGSKFVWFDNYKALFTPFNTHQNIFLKAIENSALWRSEERRVGKECRL